MSQDTYAGTLSNPLSQNRYAYVLNNPVNMWDPSVNQTEKFIDYHSRDWLGDEFYEKNYTGEHSEYHREWTLTEGGYSHSYSPAWLGSRDVKPDYILEKWYKDEYETWIYDYKSQWTFFRDDGYSYSYPPYYATHIFKRTTLHSWDEKVTAEEQYALSQQLINDFGPPPEDKNPVAIMTYTTLNDEVLSLDVGKNVKFDSQRIYQREIGDIADNPGIHYSGDQILIADKLAEALEGIGFTGISDVQKEVIVDRSNNTSDVISEIMSVAMGKPKKEDPLSVTRLVGSFANGVVEGFFGSLVESIDSLLSLDTVKTLISKETYQLLWILGKNATMYELTDNYKYLMPIVEIFGPTIQRELERITYNDLYQNTEYVGKVIGSVVFGIVSGIAIEAGTAVLVEKLTALSSKFKYLDEAVDVANKVRKIFKLKESAFGERAIKHLKKYDGFNKKRTGVTGGHNMDGFMAYFKDNNRAVKFVSEREHPQFKGLYHKEYKVSKGIEGGKFSQDEFSDLVYQKTMYDPNVYSDAQIIEWGKEALIGQEIIDYKGKYIMGTASNGMKFEGWLDDATQELRSFYPVFEWSYKKR